jgi:type II secretory pathway pseudopilin PulG
VALTTPFRAAPATRAGRDCGFMLVEAVIAVVLFGMILAATGVLVVRGLHWTGGVDRSVAATSVANEALELARARATRTAAGGAANLLAGRSPATVAQAGLDGVDLSDTALAYATADPGVAVVPLRATRTVGGTTYEVRTIVGTCRRPAAGGSCTAGTDPVGSVLLYRVIAAVTWPACRPRECPVTVATLLDTAPDPAYNALADVDLVARDKCFATPVDTALTLDPTYQTSLVRDSGDLGNDPVEVLTPPARGSLAHVPGSRPYTYTPQAGTVSTESFAYRLRDRYGAYSNPATITLQVGGAPC